MKKILPIAILIFIVLSVIALLVNFGPTSRNGIGQAIGIDNGGITIPNGQKVFDQELGGEDIVLGKCTDEGATNQKIYVAVEGKLIGVFYNIPAPAESYCWQTSKETDPAKLAVLAHWLDRNARLAGYGAMQMP